MLFQIPQRYRFSSKSQRNNKAIFENDSCFRYHKGTDFQANHNFICQYQLIIQLFQIPQRYRFLSNTIEKHADKGVRESSIIIPQTWYFLDNQGVKGMINRSFKALFEINTI